VFFQNGQVLLDVEVGRHSQVLGTIFAGDMCTRDVFKCLIGYGLD
jgi:hypothetical protein